ncbi:MAG: AraC family transcriptional regulator [Paenibacillaceae bacterium]|jgi:AraC-like DNA-binding protein|nr:AraC family transcriptional regulator [Paenibacillaceae bacterium]
MSVYGFKFNDSLLHFPVQIKSIGHEALAPDEPYDWNNRTRASDPCTYVIQYTLSGEGALELDGKTFSITPGQVFMIQYPGESRHYLPAASPGWEFVFITLQGAAMPELWTQLLDANGPAPLLHTDSAPIRLLDQIYREADKKRITDVYQASALAYQLMMELLRASRNRNQTESMWPAAIIQAAQHIREHYAEVQGPDQLAELAGLSKYYFIRLFRQTTGLTTIQFITKIRMEKAVELLRHSNLTLTDIARLTGFTSVNYFNRTFHQWVGVTPGRFRSIRGDMRADYITFD